MLFLSHMLARSLSNAATDIVLQSGRLVRPLPIPSLPPSLTSALESESRYRLLEDAPALDGLYLPLLLTPAVPPLVPPPNAFDRCGETPFTSCFSITPGAIDVRAPLLP